MGNYQQGVLPQEWLYNPVVYSQVSGDFSLLQQRILGGVLSMLQDRILYTINEKEQNKRFPSLFSDEEMGEVIELDIDPDTLGITPDHYGDLSDALRGLARLTMGFPKYAKGCVTYVVAPLFARIEMPRGEIRRTGRVHVYILRKNAEDFFSLAHGYTVHLARITQLAVLLRFGPLERPVLLGKAFLFPLFQAAASPFFRAGIQWRSIIPYPVRNDTGTDCLTVRNSASLSTCSYTDSGYEHPFFSRGLSGIRPTSESELSFPLSGFRSDLLHIAIACGRSNGVGFIVFHPSEKL